MFVLVMGVEMFPVMEKMNKPIPHHLSFLRPVCCFLVGVFFIVCIIRKPTHEERKKEINGKQTSGMAINSSGERTACLLQASRPAAEYARSPCVCYEIFHSKHNYKINAIGMDVDLHQEVKAVVKGREYELFTQPHRRKETDIKKIQNKILFQLGKNHQAVTTHTEADCSTQAQPQLGAHSPSARDGSSSENYSLPKQNKGLCHLLQEQPLFN
ncbi:uncharacterized protein [Haliaeetus albicilla]|uniref:uncharacterized protein n=1 Tax=Haliaeetus albicilla TaxID=8969 RepID=UPI0037E7B1DC